MYFITLLLTLCKSEIISPIFGKGQFEDRIVDEISNASVSLISTIYKFDNDKIYEAYINAGNRGVEMKIICDTTAYDRCSKLHNFGLITQFNMKGYDKLHAKSILVDGNTLIIGSFNLDDIGFSTNMEIGVITKDSEDIEKYVNFIDSIET